MKQSLAEAGIELDVWVTEFGQGIVSGDGERGIAWGGKGDILATYDAGRLGLWQGLSVSVHHEVNWGDDANNRGDGSIIPVNTAMAFPRLGDEDHETSLVVTQAMGRATISAGKFNMLDAASKTPIMGGGGWDTFMNTALAAPISGVTPPYIAGVIASYRTDPATFTLMVYDPRNAEDFEVIRTLYEDGVTTSLSATVPTKIGGLPGFYSLRGVYSSAEGLDLGSIPQLILPPEAQDIKDKEGYLFGSIAAQQYLWQDPDNPEVGWGLFGMFGLSDGNPNPIAWSAIAGVGGTGGFYSDLDRWGIAYFHYEMSSDLKDGLDDVGAGLEDESGVEAYYNLALTPWLRVSADLQWINPATPESENAVIGALRKQIRF